MHAEDMADHDGSGAGGLRVRLEPNRDGFWESGRGDDDPRRSTNNGPNAVDDRDRHANG